MSDGTAIFRQDCSAKVTDRIRNQVLVNRLTATLVRSQRFRDGKRWYIIGETDVDCIDKSHAWVYTIWMTWFAASRKLRGDSEQVFINQLNCRPTSVGKYNFMGHLLPCAIDSKTNHPPIHLQWIGIHGMATGPGHVISMGPRQPEVPGEAIVCNYI